MVAGTLRFPVGLLVAAVLLSACSANAPATAVATARVEMPASYRFDPAVIEVPAGTTVTWVNNDHFTHNVHVLDPLDWASPMLPPGESTTFTFEQPGEYRYQCDLHPQDMTGTVLVTR